MDDYETPGWITVGFVILIIGFNYFIFLTRFIFNWFTIEPVLCLLFSIPFHFVVILMSWSYYKAIFTSPGYVQQNINDSYSEQDIERIRIYADKERQIKKELRKKKNKKKSQKKEQEMSAAISQPSSGATDIPLDYGDSLTIDNFDIIDSLNRVSYCFKCKSIKPIRAHHCKECKRCVTRMDHHCPWVANCVGQQNNKHFILFVFYASLSCALVCITIGLDYITGATVRNLLTSEKQKLYLTMSGSMTLALTLAIGWLCFFQIKGMLSNITTVEYHVDEMHTRNPFKKPRAVDNIIELFGPNKKLWPFPVESDTIHMDDNIQYGRFENEQRV